MNTQSILQGEDINRVFSDSKVYMLSLKPILLFFLKKLKADGFQKLFMCLFIKSVTSHF